MFNSFLDGVKSAIEMAAVAKQPRINRGGVTSHPKAAELGQLPGTEAYRDVKRHPEAATFPGLLIWRIGGDLFFASIGHMSSDLKASLA